MPSISPYGLKLETYLRFAKIPYELETKDFYGEKGKIPWISLDGSHVADSHLAIQFLNRKRGIDLNKNLTPEQKAKARAARVILEEHTFWGGMQFRFVENSDKLGQLMKVPVWIKFYLPIALFLAKRKMRSQGIGLHTPTEIYDMTGEDFRTVSGLLGERKFFGGEEPCEEDCGIFGFVAQAVWGFPGSPFEKIVKGGERKNKIVVKS